GMHRSGTSSVARLLNLAGAYFGPEGVATEANEENPRGFWERRDVREVCDALLLGSGFDWWKVAGFDGHAVPADVRDTQLAAFRASADLRRLVVSYADLIASPVAVTARLLEQLEELGVEDLRLPNADGITEFVSPALHRQRRDAHERPGHLNGLQAELAALE